ncbi:EI24 domain-containing protein [Candidatus Viridilinea mediisalina]|uniref:Sulfate transporter CysZ n=1 Tax=Candidatus Viridilinea mediisalina TaxID=2024553 RepID=A0A2A6RLI4_9CHLR|nr:EI24 domain-containing protein [Candidatus Viridilinea mediisalina]PDW03793.1 hypothetical protein CJ255_06980 [Candidatus Viridilinea mediisalina]
MRDLFAGLGYPWRALGLLRRTPRLWNFVLIPIGLNLVVGLVIYVGVYFTLWRMLQAWLADSAAWAGVVLWLLGAVTAILLAVAVAFLIVRFGVVLGSPWYSQLSEELEALMMGKEPVDTPFSLRRIAYDLWRALLFEFKKLGLGLTLWIMSLLLLLLPLGGPFLHAAAGMLIGATISCLDFFDGPQERRYFSFRQKLATIRQTMPSSLSFGIIAFSLVSIPLVNLFALPLCVAAGNMLVIERTLNDTNHP